MRVEHHYYQSFTASTSHILFLRVFLPAALAFLAALASLSTLVCSCLFFLNSINIITVTFTATSFFVVSIFSIFLTAHGVSMIIGRRRPRLYDLPALQTPPRANQLQRLRLITNLSEESDVTCVQTTKKEGWCEYERETPRHVSVGWQVLLTCWSFIFHLVVHLPWRTLWDEGGLEEALLRCPFESFVSPSYHLLSGCHNMRRRDSPLRCMS